MARKVKEEVELLDEMEFDFDELLADVFGNKVTKVKLNPTLAGKKITIYSPSNNVGKTKQASMLCDYTIFIPFEEGLNAITRGSALKTASWADFKGHVAKLLGNSKMSKLLRSDKTVGIVLDGMETMAMYCKQYICDVNNKSKISDIPHGGGWSQYEAEMFSQVNKLSKTGFTLIFIGHGKPSKDDGDYIDFACDWRTGKPIRDISDFVFYVESNGVDDDGNVIPSSAYLAEHLPTQEDTGFFARSRFSYVQTYFEEWKADIVKQAIYDGIVEQAEAEGAELVGFEEAFEQYETSFNLSFEEAKERIFDMLDAMDGAELSDEADAIVLEYFSEVEELNNIKSNQKQTVQALYEHLEQALKEHGIELAD